MKYLIDVPDKIMTISGSSGHAKAEEAETTPALIYLALTVNDYHENYYFNKGKIRIERLQQSGSPIGSFLRRLGKLLGKYGFSKRV